MQVFIKGLANQNRAVQDDIVAIEMFPEARWSAPSSVIAEDAGSKEDVLDEVCQGDCFQVRKELSSFLFSIIMWIHHYFYKNKDILNPSKVLSSQWNI